MTFPGVSRPLHFSSNWVMCNCFKLLRSITNWHVKNYFRLNGSGNKIGELNLALDKKSNFPLPITLTNVNRHAVI